MKPRIGASNISQPRISDTRITQKHGTIVIAAAGMTVLILAVLWLGGFFTGAPVITQQQNCNPNGPALVLKYAVENAITKAAFSGSTTNDIITPGNSQTYIESDAVSTLTTTTSTSFKPCQSLTFHAYSTAGNGYYDTVQTLTVPGTASSCANAQQCYDLTSQPVLLFQRTTAANAQAQVGSGCGTFGGRSVALSSTSAGSATGVADCSPGSGVRVVNFNIVFTLSGASTAWGLPQPYINPIASGIQNTLGIGIWMSINSSNPTVNAPFTAISVQPTSTTIWRTYFASLPALQVDPALKPSGTSTVTVTLTFTTTVGVRVMFWFGDAQQNNVVQAGSTSNPPTNVGSFSGAGITTDIAANAALYQLSSGAPSTPILAYTINIT